MRKKYKVGEWIAGDRLTGPTSDISEIITLNGLVRNIMVGVGREDAYRITRCVNEHAEATKILESHTDLAACEADKCGCMGCTLPELAMGAMEEVAVWKEKHGLLANEVEAWRAWYKCEPHHPTKQDRTAVARNSAVISTDAAGALERAR